MEKDKVIIFAALAIIALFLFGVSEVDFTGKVSTNIVDCYDSDGGLNVEIGGHVVGSFDPTKARSDFCVNTTTVGEYYCDVARSDGKVKKIFCEFGCVEEGGFGICKSQEKAISECEGGCAYKGSCLNAGTRVEGMYCDWDNLLKVQKEGGCENNYECKSNLCLSGSCLSEQAGKNFLKDVEVTHWWE